MAIEKAMWKKWLPSSLFGRTLLMVALPLLLVQVVGTYFFYARHWDNISRYLSLSVASEIALVTQRFERLPLSAKEDWLDETRGTLDLFAKYSSTKTHENIPLRPGVKDRILKDLESQLFWRLDGRPFELERMADDSTVRVVVHVKQGELSFILSKKRLTSSTIQLVLIVNAVVAMLVLLVSLLFLRNQVRPIVALARAADRFGRGLDLPNFHPHGAREVRMAAGAFLIMKERIQRMVDSRTEMLAAVSHDLRTPLARMKLQLEMMPTDQVTEGLRHDVRDMEAMVSEYLDFVRGGTQEPAKSTSVADTLRELAARYQALNANVDVMIDDDVSIPLKPHAFKRAVGNLIDNSLRYGTRCFLRLAISPLFVSVIVEDDGPGIPEAQREEVFLPFRRLDEARNLDSHAAAGLGLSIVREVVHAHGGQIHLDDAPLGGLRATIIIPRQSYP